MLLVIALLLLLLKGPASIGQPIDGSIMAALLIVGLPAWGAWYVFKHVWPTPYRMEHADGHLVRIHRRSGLAEIMTPEGWRSIKEPDSD